MNNETTRLTPDEEAAFQAWARANDIRDVDHAQSRYDYRGYWKQIASKGGEATRVYDDGLHFTDKFKQHGHETFSRESQYSAGPHDGGRWIAPPIPGSELMMTSRGPGRVAYGESFVPWGADMMTRSPRDAPLDANALAQAIRILVAKMGQ